MKKSLLIKPAAFVLLAALLTILLFTGCASTGGANSSDNSGISGFDLSEDITDPKKIPDAPVEKFDAFGMIEVTLISYPYNVNGTYKDKVSLKIMNNKKKESFTVKTDSNGFFYIKDLDKFTSYTIELAGIRPDKQNPQSEWSFGIWKNFSGSIDSVINIGAIKVSHNFKTKDYQIKYEEEEAITEYEKQYNTKFAKIEFNPPASYDNVQKYKTDRVEPTIAEFISRADVAKLQKRNPDGYIKVVCHKIKQISENDFDTVRLVHDVVTEILSYDVKSYFSGRISSQDYKTVMKSGKSVCAGYATVFNEFCNKLGIPCIEVSGFAKGAGFNPENPDISTNHSWNMVCAEGAWYLIDCTWDSGYLNGTENVKQYRSDYLFVKPEHMIYSHYPEEQKYQLLEKPFNEKDILFVPNIKPFFFTDFMNGSYLEVESFDTDRKEFVFLAHYRNSFTLTVVNKTDVTGKCCTEEQISDNCKRFTVKLREPGVYQVTIKNDNWTWNNIFAFVVR